MGELVFTCFWRWNYQRPCQLLPLLGEDQDDASQLDHRSSPLPEVWLVERLVGRQLSHSLPGEVVPVGFPFWEVCVLYGPGEDLPVDFPAEAVRMLPLAGYCVVSSNIQGNWSRIGMPQKGNGGCSTPFV